MFFKHKVKKEKLRVSNKNIEFFAEIYRHIFTIKVKVIDLNRDRRIFNKTVYLSEKHNFKS